MSEQEAVFVLYFESDPTEPQLSGDHEPIVHVKLGFLSLENLKNSTAQGVDFQMWVKFHLYQLVLEAGA